MVGTLFFVEYFAWHYSSAFRDVTSFWMNIAWFVTHYFSIPLLFRTLFSPWKRVTAEHTKRGIEDLAATIVFNIMSRIVGAFVRSMLIIVGLTALLVVLTGYCVFLVLWTLLPAVTLALLMGGLTLILT